MNTSEQQQFEQGFWQQHDRFLRNGLLTEQSHPDTGHLAEWAKADLPQAIATLKSVDQALLVNLAQYQADFLALQRAMYTTRQQGGRVFICGCGATGRLAVSLEILWRRAHAAQSDSVRALIAGGDTALIHSIEKFEDQREFGLRQLTEAGFGQQDLLIAASAGGESPFVLAAAEYAAAHSRQPPWLIYCNPDATLLERSPDHPLRNPKIRAWSLLVGEMALTGSTRMQATSALMLAIGLPLLEQAPLYVPLQLSRFADVLAACDFSQLSQFIIREAEIYQQRDYVLYRCGAENALTVLTDTTERAPTFNLQAFDNRGEPNSAPSGCYLLLAGAPDSETAWRTLLGRAPQALAWPEFPITSLPRLYGFDFSEQVKEWREARLGKIQVLIDIVHEPGRFIWRLEHLQAVFNDGGLAPLWQQLLLKLLLNTHSTLVMGRLGLYEGNLMTSVTPSNYKLVDRAIRYTMLRYQQLNAKLLSYDTAAAAVFAELQTLRPGESIVYKALRRLSASF